MNVFTKLGPYAWISGAILSAETLLVVKFGRGEFTAPFPERVKIAWGIFGASLTVVLVGWQLWIWIFSYLQRASPPNESSLNQKQKAY
jgi:phosphatidylserine synthase 2